MDDLDPRIDALYAGPPALFTKARDALAKELAAEGDDASGPFSFGPPPSPREALPVAPPHDELAKARAKRAARRPGAAGPCRGR